MKSVNIYVPEELIDRFFMDKDIEQAYREMVGDNSYYETMIEKLKYRYRNSSLALGIFSAPLFHQKNEMRIKHMLLNIAINDVIISKNKSIISAVRSILNECGYKIIVDGLQEELEEFYDPICGPAQEPES